MIQHTYDVQTFDDGNKIIRPALSNEYEALLGCLEPITQETETTKIRNVLM